MSLHLAHVAAKNAGMTFLLEKDIFMYSEPNVEFNLTMLYLLLTDQQYANTPCLARNCGRLLFGVLEFRFWGL